MPMKRAAENATDPATGKRFPDGVEYRGVGQYRGRKMVDGRRVKKTFYTAKDASAWLLKVIVEHREGVHVSRIPAFFSIQIERRFDRILYEMRGCG